MKRKVDIYYNWLENVNNLKDYCFMILSNIQMHAAEKKKYNVGMLVRISSVVATCDEKAIKWMSLM